MRANPESGNDPENLDGRRPLIGGDYNEKLSSGYQTCSLKLISNFLPTPLALEFLTLVLDGLVDSLCRRVLKRQQA